VFIGFDQPHWSSPDAHEDVLCGWNPRRSLSIEFRDSHDPDLRRPTYRYHCQRTGQHVLLSFPDAVADQRPGNFRLPELEAAPPSSSLIRALGAVFFTGLLLDQMALSGPTPWRTWLRTVYGSMTATASVGSSSLLSAELM
jgi:hypothetical protein